MITRRLVWLTLVVSFFSISPFARAAAERDWRSGKLLSIDKTEQQVVSAPKKETKDTSDYNSNGNSSTSTSTRTTTVSGGPTGRTVPSYWYVVTDGTKFYTARITSTWSNLLATPAKVDIGAIKFVVDGKNLILQGANGKEYKAEITRTAMTAPTGPPDPGPPIVDSGNP